MATTDQKQEWTPVTFTIGLVAGLAMVLGLGWGLLWIAESFSRFQAAQAAKERAASAPLDPAAVNGKVDPALTAPVARSADPASYAKLGSRAFGTANELRRWAALAAAQSKACDRVASVAVWDRSTSAALSWRIGCANGETFVIPEDQARSVRAQLDPEATLEDRKRYAALVTIAQPVSAAWKAFDEGLAVVTCENVMERVAVDRGSFSGEGRWSVERDLEAGLAVIERDYSAANALGGRISGTYHCTVAAQTGNVVGLVAHDLTGAHRVL